MSETIQRPTRRITRQRLQNILAQISGARMCTIVFETEPRMRKTNNPFVGLITKRCRMNVTINFTYANSVNNQRAKEGNEPDFVPHERKWGQRVPSTPFVLHNGRMYVEVKPNGAPQLVEYVRRDTGEMIDKQQLEAWLQSSNSNAEHQGVEKEIILRDIMIENITELIYGGVHYIVRR